MPLSLTFLMKKLVSEADESFLFLISPQPQFDQTRFPGHHPDALPDFSRLRPTP